MHARESRNELGNASSPDGTAGALDGADRGVSTTPRRSTAFDRALAARVQQSIADSTVRLELWDRSSPYDSSRPSIGDLVVHDRGTLIGLAVNPDLYFGEAYMAGRLDVRGGLEPVVEALTRTTPLPTSWRARIARAVSVPNTLRTARDNVHHHYDLGNDFYQQWLDRELVYTCAYFERPNMSLDEAQEAKLDLVCRKLQLRPGHSVVEAGCGWGALALYMAKRYGVRVKAFNVSQEQLAFARERAAREGLTDRVEFIDDDYRNVRGTFDVFVSVGMLEHVGLTHFHSFRRSGPAQPAAGWWPRPASLHWPGHAVRAQCLDQAPNLSRRLHANAQRGRNPHSRSRRHVDRRR